MNKINLEVTDIESQFHDGVYLIMLMGLLEGFFVPLYSFYSTPRDFDQKVHNVGFAFELMEEVGLPRPKARPEGKKMRFIDRCYKITVTVSKSVSYFLYTIWLQSNQVTVIE